jgi:enterochelin esterase family protein
MRRRPFYIADAMKTLLAILLSLTAVAFSQQAPDIVSPEVQAGGKTTFRFLDPNAKDVKLMLEGEPKPLDMARDDSGVWSLTVGPLAPEIYGYIFIADGVFLMDPNNPNIKPNLISPQNTVRVPGETPTLWEVANVPHGVVHHHFYKSKVVGDQRDYFVYTPPGFDSRAKTKYPVFYLLHGYSDRADGWTAVGQANVILDNLIAAGKVKPMIVVMPLGYGTPKMIQYKWGAWQHPELRQENFDKFRQALLTEVMPQVEAAYPVSAKREDRAIAGLSMGGAESLQTGLNNIDKFAYVGAFSAGGLPETFATEFPSLNAKSGAQLKSLWIACGASDGLIEPNRKFKAWLKSQNVPFTDIETPGAHTWMVWRDNLINFTPLLFNTK